MITKLDIWIHKQYLLRILLEFSRDPILSRNLAFKWWTALLLFYWLDRFSTDLDFDLIKSDLSEDDILERIQNILKKLWNLKEIYNKRYTIFALLSYGELDYNIKIEINKRWLSWKYSRKNLLWIELNVLDLKDMCANKFLALLGRNKLANRDIYDIFFILDNWFEINKELLEEKSSITFSEYINKCISLLEWLPKNYNILDWLWLTLNEEKKDFVKKRLITETIFLLKSMIF